MDWPIFPPNLGSSRVYWQLWDGIVDPVITQVPLFLAISNLSRKQHCWKVTLTSWSHSLCCLCSTHSEQDFDVKECARKGEKRRKFSGWDLVRIKMRITRRLSNNLLTADLNNDSGVNGRSIGTGNSFLWLLSPFLNALSWLFMIDKLLHKESKEVGILLSSIMLCKPNTFFTFFFSNSWTYCKKLATCSGVCPHRKLGLVRESLLDLRKTVAKIRSQSNISEDTKKQHPPEAQCGTRGLLGARTNPTSCSLDLADMDVGSRM